MSTPATTAVLAFLQPLLPPGWALQSGLWHDKGPTVRHCVLKPAGGPRAGLVREPQFTVQLLGAANDSAADIGAVADTIVAATQAGHGSLVNLQASEPAYTETADGRHLYDLALSAMTT